MSDYFTSLIERSVGIASAIRPRLTSLFEPTRSESPSIGNTFASAPEETPFHLETERDAESPRRQKGNLHVAHSLPEDDEQQTSTVADTSRVSSTLSPRVRDDHESQRAVVESAAKREEAKSALQPPIRQEAPKRTLVVPKLREQETTLVEPPAAVPQIVTPPRRQVKDAEGERGLVIPPKLTPEMRLADLALSARQNRREQEKRSLLWETSQPSEPTVQVTIGRIEVRATKESSQSPPADSKSPVMSLDEYLRGRARQVSQ